MNNMKTIFTFLAGSALGVTVGFLTAPRSGKKSRQILKKEIDQTADAVVATSENRLEEAKGILNRTVAEKAKRGKKAIDRLKETVTGS